MLLSEEDIRCLEKLGYNRENFGQLNEEGFAQLKNREKYCVFYDIEGKRCKVYRSRPLGCRIYPVVFCEEEDAAVVDDLCPVGDTVSERKLRSKGKRLVRLLRVIDAEAERRRPRGLV
jgi:Fe-S-cluster containining protein